MTPAELLALAEAATPGPWRASKGGIYEEQGWGWEVEGPDWHYDAELKPADARLIALAPDLARLCAEMGEALGQLRKWAASEWPEQKAAIYRADDALAKLSELETQA